MERIKSSHFNKFFRSLVLKSFFATTWIDFPVNVDSLLAGIYFRVGGFFFWIWFLDKLLLFRGVGGSGFRFLLSFNLIAFVFFRTSSSAFYINKDNNKITTSNKPWNYQIQTNLYFGHMDTGNTIWLSRKCCTLFFWFSYQHNLLEFFWTALDKSAKGSKSGKLLK